MSVASPLEATDHRTALIRRAFRLEYITLAWMTVEAVVAIGSGVAAGSLALTAFGIDSLIELVSAAVLVWRLNVELRHGQAFAEAALDCTETIIKRGKASPESRLHSAAVRPAPEPNRCSI